MWSPWWVPGAGRCPSWGLSGAKPAWVSGGTPPTKAPVDCEGKSVKLRGWDEEGVTGLCGEGSSLYKLGVTSGEDIGPEGEREILTDLLVHRNRTSVTCRSTHVFIDAQ